MNSRSRTLLLAALAAASLLGCRRDEPYHVQVAKSAQVEAPQMPPQMPPRMGQMPPPGMGQQMPPQAEAQGASDDAPQMPPDHPNAGQMPPGMAGNVEAPPPPANGLNWKLPAGWTESRTGGIRYATLKPPGDAQLDVSVVVLSGTAGGESANVNRWRGQLGLDPIDDKAIAAARKSVTTAAGQLSVYDFTGDGDTKSRMVAAMITAEGSTWFVKMVGDAKAVGAARGDFDHLLQSLSFQ